MKKLKLKKYICEAMMFVPLIAMLIILLLIAVGVLGKEFITNYYLILLVTCLGIANIARILSKHYTEKILEELEWNSEQTIMLLKNN